MNQPYGGQFPGGQYGQQPYGAPPAPYGAPQPGYPQAQPGYPQQQPGYAQPGMPQTGAQPGMPQTGGYPAQPGYPQSPQPGYPQQQAPQGGFGRILLQSSYFFLAWRLSKVPMTVFVDGVPQQMQWGQTFIDVPGGQHQLAIQGDYRGRIIGQAQTVAQVMPGQQSMIYYRAPALASSPGAAGPNPQQPTNGLAVSLSISLIPLAIALIVLIVTLAT